MMPAKSSNPATQGISLEPNRRISSFFEPLVKKSDQLAATAYVDVILRTMSLYFRLSPTFRRQLKDTKTGRYRYVFEARFLFRTRDDSVVLHAIFADGQMRLGHGRITNPDLTFTFKNPAAMRRLFSPTRPADPLTMMLENQLSVEGNLMYLAKFGHLSKEMNLGRKKRKALAGRRTNPNLTIVHNPTARSSHPLAHRAILTSQPHDRVAVLEEPFLSRYRLEDFPRLKLLRERLYVNLGEVCTERPRLLTEYFLKYGFEKNPTGQERDPEIRQAEALHHILSHREPIIRDLDLLAGTSTTKEVGVLIYPEFGGALLWPELLTVDERKLNPYKISAEDIDILNFEVFPFWTDRNIMEYTRRKYGNPRCQQLDDRWVLYFSWKPHAVSHTVPNFPLLLERGLLDLSRQAREKENQAKTEKERNFYRGLQIAQEGVLAYANNLRRKATEMAAGLREDDPGEVQRKKDLLALVGVLTQVPAYPARTLREALNAIWIAWVSLHMENMNAGLSLGRLDLWLQPYFLKDVARATNSEEKEETIRQALELVGSFYLKCADHLPAVPDIGNRLFGGSSSDQALTLGGVDRVGESAVCDMTYIFLKVTEMLALRDPNVNARYYPGINSPEYLKRLIEVNTITAATPSLHNDSVIIPALVNQGFALEDARDWAATGCVEPTSAGRHFGHTNSMLLNTVAPLEMALHDGIHPLIGERIGPRTGDPLVHSLSDNPVPPWTGVFSGDRLPGGSLQPQPADPLVHSLPGQPAGPRAGDLAAPETFPTFDAFLAAYKKQLAFLIDQAIEYNNLLGLSHQYLHPTPLLSSLFEGPMEKAKDVIEGGAVYNTSGAALVSLTDAVDSLLAIKDLVYEHKVVDWPTLLAALAADFVGYEALQARILTKVPKFGTNQEARDLAQELIDFIYDEYQRHFNYRGGRYTSGFWSMSNHVAFGTLSGALPSGRRKGQPFTPGITPSPNAADQLLANIRTIASLNPLKMPNNIAFNVKVAPGPQDTHGEFVERVTAYARTYFELGGMQMQFNIVTTETLKDAMAHPENYRWLLVRISGYNAYFVELNEEMQKEIIRRTEFNLLGNR